MKPRNIPGYYFDAEKGKYFKIQANHQAAPDSKKYAQSEVNRERRQHKKQKIERCQLEIRSKHTVKRAPVLHHPSTGGIALHRELGSRRHVTNLQARDTYQVSQMRSERQRIIGWRDTSTTAYVPVPALGGVIVATSGPTTRAMRFMESRRDPSREYGEAPESWPRRIFCFDGSVVSISVAPEVESTTIVVCSRASVPSNVFFGIIPHDEDLVSRTIYMQLGAEDTSLWASALHQRSRYTAITGTDNLFVLGSNGALLINETLDSESRAVAWLDPNIIAYGQHGQDMHGGVHLYDIRSAGRRRRFPRKKPITSITSLDDGVRLIVSDNTSINLYDTRMPSSPLFSFAHVHQGPQLQSAMLTNEIMAALDVDNAVQTYSLRSAKKCGTLPSNGRYMTSLVARDTDNGPALYACQDDRMLSWTTRGIEKDGA